MILFSSHFSVTESMSDQLTVFSREAFVMVYKG